MKKNCKNSYAKSLKLFLYLLQITVKKQKLFLKLHANEIMMIYNTGMEVVFFSIMRWLDYFTRWIGRMGSKLVLLS